MKKIILFALGLVFVAAGCTSNSYLRHDKTLVLKEHKYSVQIADTPSERSMGLSGKPNIGETEGMLFVFSEPQRPSFWMKGMVFPIDIIWIKDNTIVEIADNIPVQPNVSDEQLSIYTPRVDVDKVLEVKSGWIFRHDIRVGDKIELQNP